MANKGVVIGTLIVGGIIVAGVTAIALSSKAGAEPEGYSCPICGLPFDSYEELYAHFTSEHPAEPIDIIWE